MPNSLLALALMLLVGLPWRSHAQAVPSPVAPLKAGPERSALVHVALSFTSAGIPVPEGTAADALHWNFGDGTTATGDQVSHLYRTAGTYLATLTYPDPTGRPLQDTTTVRVFDRAVVLVADDSVADEPLTALTPQAAANGILLVTLKARTDGPEAIVEEELTNLMVDSRATVARAHAVATWTAGGVGPNVLSKFAQRLRSADIATTEALSFERKGILLITTARFGLLAPLAQSTFDQLHPQYVLLTRPEAWPFLLTGRDAEATKDAVLASPISRRLFGTFSERTVQELGPTNFMSFGINYLVNHGIPINNVILVLTIPVIATLVSFTRQVIGIRALGLITPAMTTLSLLVLGLPFGLAVFLVILLSGTLTRLLVRRLRLLYLPRMALVLAMASLAILLLFGLAVRRDQAATVSFSIFPILIMIILAEEFIAIQFKSGARAALSVTAWTLGISIAAYYLVSLESLRTLLVSYPEIVLLALPINILLGRFTGLRLIEYIRFRQIPRALPPTEG